MGLTGRKGKRWSGVDSARVAGEVIGEMGRSHRVAEVMNRRQLCVRRETTSASALEALLDHGVEGAPVVDDDGRFLGLVTLADLASARTEDDTSAEPPLAVRHRKLVYEVADRGFHALDPGKTVEDVMRTGAGALREAAPLAQAAAVLAGERVPCVAIVDSERRVVGVVGSRDLLAWWARQDGYEAPASSPRPRKVAS